MLKTFFTHTRRIMLVTGIGLLVANCLMADLLPFPTRKRPRPIPMNADPASQQPVRPYIQRTNPQEAEKPEPMTATMYGKLIYLDNLATSDVNYALCRKVEEKLVPVCFIKWDGRTLTRYINHEVRVTGFIREMKGWTCPLLVVEYPENIEFAHQEEEKPKPPMPEPVPLPPPQTAEPLPPPQAAQPLPPSKPAKPLPSSQPAKPLPPSQPAKLQPLLREESRIMPPSNYDYKPQPPKAVNPVRTTP